jgi:hypothetical protein
MSDPREYCLDVATGKCVPHTWAEPVPLDLPPLALNASLSLHLYDDACLRVELVAGCRRDGSEHRYLRLTLIGRDQEYTIYPSWKLAKRLHALMGAAFQEEGLLLMHPPGCTCAQVDCPRAQAVPEGE